MILPKTITRLFLFVFVLMASYDASFAQKRTFDEFTQVQLRNLAPIRHHNEVIGYCMFYYIDKAKEKYKANFKIVLLDSDLNKVADQPLVHYDDVELYEVAYNGTNLLLVFFNESDGLFEYIQYDLQLKEKGRCTAELASTEKSMISENIPAFSSIIPHVVPIEGQGFAMYSFFGSFELKYSITFVSNESVVRWEIENTEGDGKRVLPTFLAENKEVALNVLVPAARGGFLYKAYSLKTGKNVFVKEILLDGHPTKPLGATVDAAGDFVVTGMYYGDKDEKDREDPIGVFMASINAKGEVLKQKLYPWKEIDATKLGLDELGSYKDKGLVRFQNTLVLPNGHLALIGECFEKTNKLTYGEIYYNDLVVLELDQNFQIVGTQIAEKRNGPVTATRVDFKNNERFEEIINYPLNHAFRYVQADASGYSVFFRRPIQRDEKGTYLGILSRQLGESEVTIDKIKKETEASTTDILMAKAGHVLFVEYFAKTKKLDLRLEKFNY